MSSSANHSSANHSSSNKKSSTGKKASQNKPLTTEWPAGTSQMAKTTEVQHWRVSWNAKLYDYSQAIKAFLVTPAQNSSINQSKGRAVMRNLPKIGDIVVVTCKGFRRMQCEVTGNFRTVLPSNNLQQHDEFNRGEVRHHAENNTYLEMKIRHVYPEDTMPLRGVQRTWSKLPSGESICPEL